MATYAIDTENVPDWRMSVLEHRSARRFKVGWPVTVKGTDSSGLSFDEAGALENLSSSGAFVYLTRPLDVGAQIDVRIKVPFKKESWMVYSAEVVRIERAPAKIGVAMRFSTARPVFKTK